MMSKDKKQALEAKGWKTTTVEEFLELTPEESLLIDLQLETDEQPTNNEIKENKFRVDRISEKR